MAVFIGWTPEIIGRLSALWGEGVSTAAIRAQLGVSKNAVVGKVHRLNLPARPSPIRRGPGIPGPKRQPRTPIRLTTNLPVVVRPAPDTQPTPPPAAQVYRQVHPLTCSIIKTQREDDGCCWPIGEPGTPGFSFCGRANRRNAPYCEEHCGLAYMPRTARRRSLEGSVDALA